MGRLCRGEGADDEGVDLSGVRGAVELRLSQEMRHFARCVRGKEAPQATGEDGRLVMEVLLAGYSSAGKDAESNCRSVPPA